jgi:hypothetical protein
MLGKNLPNINKRPKSNQKRDVPILFEFDLFVNTLYAV